MNLNLLELRKCDSQALAFATSSTFRKEGNLDAAKLIKLSVSTPESVSKIFKSSKQELSSASIQMSEDQALALAIDCSLTKHQYNLLRLNSRKTLGKYMIYILIIKILFLKISPKKHEKLIPTWKEYYSFISYKKFLLYFYFYFFLICSILICFFSSAGINRQYNLSFQSIPLLQKFYNNFY